MNKNSLLYNYQYSLRILSAILLITGVIYQTRFYKIAILGGILSILFIGFFFRNNFTKQSYPGYFISPSSSRITKIKEHGAQKTIFTYLSPIDRHFMIAPTDGVVTKIDRKKTCITDAERLTIWLKNSHGDTFKLSQIVSKIGQGPWLLNVMYPTRCLVFCRVGDYLSQGERYGLIRFGSSMEYVIPSHIKINKSPGTHCELGKPLGRIHNFDIPYKKTPYYL